MANFVVTWIDGFIGHLCGVASNSLSYGLGRSSEKPANAIVQIWQWFGNPA